MERVLVMGSKDGNPKWFGDRKGLSHLKKNLRLYKIIACTQFWGDL